VCSGDDLAERRMRLIENADIVIVLPGGPGTFDELWETSVYRILGLRGMQHIPLCVVNIDGYFDGTIAQITRANEEQLLYDSPDEYFHVEADVESALRWSLEACDALLSRKSAAEVHATAEAHGQGEGGEKGGSAWSSAEGGAMEPPVKTVFH
ncbi:LOGL3, partial [Symbiodinium microadriaticum]